MLYKFSNNYASFLTLTVVLIIISDQAPPKNNKKV